eukprot:12155069-Alexandrium_andersonii.AAC.1
MPGLPPWHHLAAAVSPAGPITSRESVSGGRPLGRSAVLDGCNFAAGSPQHTVDSFGPYPGRRRRSRQALSRA